MFRRRPNRTFTGLYDEEEHLPLDDQRFDTRRRNTRSPYELERDNFRATVGRLEYWRNRPLRELDIMINRYSNLSDPQSVERAQRLKHIKNQIHDPKRAHPHYNVQSIDGQRRTLDPSQLRSGSLLPPAGISGRITGGNYPRRPNISDVHPGYSQMSGRTQQLLSARHRAAGNRFRRLQRLPEIEDRNVDQDMQRLRRYDFGTTRRPYSLDMETTGAGLDVDRYRRDVPRTLATRFRELSISADNERETNSRNTQSAGPEIWRQRQLDKRYHPRSSQHPPREHTFGAQQRPKYAEKWKTEAKKVMPFAPLMDYYSDRPAVGPSSASSSGPSRIVSSRAASFDQERPQGSQRLANRYMSESRDNRTYQPLPRDQRIGLRRQRWPLVEGVPTHNQMRMDMSENGQPWEYSHRYEMSPTWSSFVDSVIRKNQRTEEATEAANRASARARINARAQQRANQAMSQTEFELPFHRRKK